MAPAQTGHLDIPEGKLYWEYGTHDSPRAIPASRPTLLFIHAGVADLHLWDEQVSYFRTIGWNTLRYDLFGYGKSAPNETFLHQSPRPRVKHHDHPALLARHLATINNPASSDHPDPKVIAIGLSRGGATAIDFALTYPDMVAGVVVVAGGLSGFDVPPDPREEKLFAEEPRLQAARDIDALATFNVRVWGDGPLQVEGRLREEVRKKLYNWGVPIAEGECDGTGGFGIKYDEPDPPAVHRLAEIKVPVAVALGRFDESTTNLAMRYVAEHVELSTIKEFDAAHMVNLEFPAEFNAWVDMWLRDVVA